MGTPAPLVLLLAAALAPGAAAACDHPYFPMARGVSHVYRASGVEVTDVVTGVAGEVVTLSVTTGAGATLRTSTVTQTCTAEGIGAQTLRSGDGATSQRTLERSGPEFGSAAQMQVGGAWAFHDVTETVRAGMTVRRERRSSSKAVATEQVHVAAGDYQALRVESVVDVATSMSGAAAGRVPRVPPRHTTSVAWFAKGVGLVKLVTTDEAGEASPAVELVRFSR